MCSCQKGSKARVCPVNSGRRGPWCGSLRERSSWGVCGSWFGLSSVSFETKVGEGVRRGLAPTEKRCLFFCTIQETKTEKSFVGLVCGLGVPIVSGTPLCLSEAVSSCDGVTPPQAEVCGVEFHAWWALVAFVLCVAQPNGGACGIITSGLDVGHFGKAFQV